jgi:spore maturation protein CgeB
MTRILFVKQRIRRGPAIESSIEDFVVQAFNQEPGAALDAYDLGEKIRLEEDLLQGATPADYQRTRFSETEKCLRYIRDNGYRNIFVLNGYLLNHFYQGFFAELRRHVDRIVVWQLDDPYYVDLILPFLVHLDAVFTVDSSTVPLYRHYVKVTEWLPLACDPAVHRPLDVLAPKYRSDVCFIGVPFKGSTRVQTIDELAPRLAGFRAKFIGAAGQDNWRNALSNYKLVADQVMEVFVPVEEAVRYFCGAAINLNLHKDSYGHMWDRNSHRIPAMSPCERTFSIAGCGAFQLIDSTRPDLVRLFDVGKDIVSFGDMADLVGKIRYYLNHEKERREIAASALDIVLRRHTYRHRVQRILEVAFSGA